MGLMPVSLTATKDPGTVCTGGQRELAQVNLLGAQPSQEGRQPQSSSRIDIQLICPPCPRKKTSQGTAASVATHQQREVHPWKGNSLFDKLWRPFQKTRFSNRYGICHKCGDHHANLSRHSSGCDRTTPETIPSHSDGGLGGEPFARNPATSSTPAAAENPNQSDQSSQSRRFPWEIEDVGPMLDALDGTTLLARMSLTKAKSLRQEHRMLFARSLRHALRILCQAHNALQVAPVGGPHNKAFVTHFETATKLLHVTPALPQSSNGRCSWQRRYN